MADTDVVIVGAGHNGLVAATYLARAGLGVRVFERRPFVGGSAITEELWPGFYFSTCAHMIHGIHPKIIRDLRLYERGLVVVPRPFRVYLRPDGTYWGPEDQDSPRNLAVHYTPEEREALGRYEAFKGVLRRVFAPYRLGPPPTLDEVRARVAGSSDAGALEKALRAGVIDLQDEFLPTDRLKDRLVDEWASIGRNPLGLAHAYFSMNAPEEETGENPPNGCVNGGVGEVSRTMVEAAEEAGARIQVGCAVEEILVEGGKAVGVRLADGTVVRSRRVVSNLDPKRTFLRLIAAGHLTGAFLRRVEGLITHVSCCKLLAAVSELPRWRFWDGDPDRPSSGVVRLVNSRDEARAAFEDLEAGRPPQVPLINFTVPSVLDPNLAPPGRHTASVWVYPAPGKLKAGAWDGVRERVAEGLIDQITEYAPNFRDSILHYKFRTPQDLERENGLTDGCIWHIQHEGDQLFWNRPLPELAAYRAPIHGLYLCGAGQHPGGEVSGLPGHNAAHEILKDL